MKPTDAQIEMGALAIRDPWRGVEWAASEKVLTAVLSDIVTRLEELPHDEFCNVQSRSRGFVCDCAKGEALAVVRGEVQ